MSNFPTQGTQMVKGEGKKQERKKRCPGMVKGGLWEMGGPLGRATAEEIAADAAVWAAIGEEMGEGGHPDSPARAAQVKSDPDWSSAWVSLASAGWPGSEGGIPAGVQFLGAGCVVPPDQRCRARRR